MKIGIVRDSGIRVWGIRAGSLQVLIIFVYHSSLDSKQKFKYSGKFVTYIEQSRTHNIVGYSDILRLFVVLSV